MDSAGVIHHNSEVLDMMSDDEDAENEADEGDVEEADLADVEE